MPPATNGSNDFLSILWEKITWAGRLALTITFIIVIVGLMALAIRWWAGTYGDNSYPRYDPVGEEAQAVQKNLPLFLTAEHKYYAAQGRFSASCPELQSYDADFAAKVSQEGSTRRFCQLKLSDDGQRLTSTITLAKFNNYTPQVFSLVLTPQGVVERTCQAQIQLGCVHGTWEHLKAHSAF